MAREESELKLYSDDDLKQLKSIRETSFWKQFYLLFLRVIIGFWRQPLFVGGVFGNALFAVVLISSMYYNTGAFNLSWDMNKNKTVNANTSTVGTQLAEITYLRATKTS